MLKCFNDIIAIIIIKGAHWFVQQQKIWLNGKGSCTLCHNKMGRAPMLSEIGKNAPERLKDPRYKGTAKNLEEYIYESETKPSAYVVAGFGKSGTNDTESPMPVTTGGASGSPRLRSRPSSPIFRI